MILKVGLTGGIGSGKTTVAKIFETLRIPVYYADERAKQLMNTDPELKNKIIELFGPEAYLKGQLNRPFIASVVFSDKLKLEQLNRFVHPATIADGESWMQAQTTPYAVKEAALIFESKVNLHLDYVIGVTAPAELRVRRVSERDELAVEEVKKRMKHQMSDEEKMNLCDFVIQNNETEPLIPQVISIHEKLLAFAAERNRQ